MLMLSILNFYIQFTQQLKIVRQQESMVIKKIRVTPNDASNDDPNFAWSRNLYENLEVLSFYDMYSHKILEMIYTILNESRAAEQLQNCNSGSCKFVNFVRKNYSLMPAYMRCLNTEQIAYYVCLTDKYMVLDLSRLAATLGGALEFLAPFAAHIVDYVHPKMKIPELSEKLITLNFIDDRIICYPASNFYDTFKTHLYRIRQNILSIRCVLDGVMRTLNEYVDIPAIYDDVIEEITNYLNANYKQMYGEDREKCWD
ncbi:hypothetical protein VCUG_00992 [Vavraia culicis subsp. floridensis]|uniref:Uncharacterized protein n=1 Tax=Vavraia culicis (isolate floridensis) TaxID=948595 RepID=L2GV68_VAVCU|nr:uncharacterized protein VCUG_00992 [Vavraia culicis subsp. floridensis]ELA47561.1 hypothetical protein VCUG_00992 [Vavraia culicis subsp. floridensis]